MSVQAFHYGKPEPTCQLLIANGNANCQMLNATAVTKFRLLTPSLSRYTYSVTASVHGGSDGVSSLNLDRLNTIDRQLLIADCQLLSANCQLAFSNWQ